MSEHWITVAKMIAEQKKDRDFFTHIMCSAGTVRIFADTLSKAHGWPRRNFKLSEIDKASKIPILTNEHLALGCVALMKLKIVSGVTDFEIIALIDCFKEST